MTRRWQLWSAGLTLTVGSTLCGCGAIGLPSFQSGAYEGEPTCEIVVVDPSGADSTEEFIASIALTIDEDEVFTIDGVTLVLGASMTRSLPEADLAFEVTKILRGRSVLTVELQPRPTLPGITVEGRLIETYSARSGAVHAVARADLLVTDVSGVSAFTIRCDGTLPLQASNE